MITTTNKIYEGPVRSFVFGLLISGLILGIIFTTFLFFTFNLAGGESIQEIENRNNVLLILTVFMTLSAGLKFRKYLKASRKFTAYGIIVLPIVTFISIIVFYLCNFNFNEPLDKVIWERNNLKPLDMAATLVKEDKLINMNLVEIRGLLGVGKEEYEDPNLKNVLITYYVEEDWIMRVFLKNGKVVNVTLCLPYLGV